MTDFNEPTYVEWFKREVALPGTFAATYPESTDALVAASLMDGFAYAQLDGWLLSYQLDLGTAVVTPDLPQPAVALVVIYAGTRFIQNELKNRPSRTSYSAGGGIEATTEFAPSVMVERLKELQAMKDRLVTAAQAADRTTVVYMHDGYALRAAALYAVEGNLYDASQASAQIQALR